MRQLKEGKVATAVFDHHVKVHVCLPEDLLKEEKDGVEKVTTYLQDYFKKNARKDWGSYFDFEIDPIGEGIIDVDMYIEGEYMLTPGTAASWDYPGDPDDIEYPFEEDDFQDYVDKAMQKAPKPFDINFDLDTEFIEYPSDDEIADKLNDNLSDDGYADYLYDRWKDSQIESVMQGVLNGKSLTEAMQVNEREFWELQPEEVYADSGEEYKYRMKQDFKDWKSDAQVKVNRVAAAIRDLQQVLDDCDKFEIYYESIPGCPFKQFSNLAKDTNKWTKEFFELLDKSELN